MIAFQLKYWDSAQLIPGDYKLMEANFPLFFGLAVQMYESTLVSDRAPFDLFMEGRTTALTQEQLRGLLTFINFGDGTQVVGGQFANLFTGVSKGSAFPAISARSSPRRPSPWWGPGRSRSTSFPKFWTDCWSPQRP